MPISLSMNIASLGVQLELSSSTGQVARSSERLSSGMRINHAADDAAGLAISSDLNTAARVYTQGVRNANDGISAISIAESGISQLSNILTRQRELAVQSANGAAVSNVGPGSSESAPGACD